MTLTIGQIAKSLGVEVLGEADLVVSGLAEPQMAGPEDLALAMSPRYAETLSKGQAQAAVLWPGADWQALGLKAALTPGRSRLAMSRLTAAFDKGPDWVAGVHPAALVDPAAVLGKDVTIGAFAVVGAGAQIGDGCRIGPQVTIAAGAEIGANALIFPGVRIGPRVKIGARAVIHPNAVLGADGFSFVTEEVSQVEMARHTLGETEGTLAQSWQKIHSLGGVEIGDDVEIGANAAVDYGTIRATRIGSRTKLDNLVHVAHNVIIGEDCLICGQVGIAGSTVIGNYCVLGGQVGVADNLRIGDRVICGAASKVLSNVPAGRVIQGYPAVKMQTHVESYKALRRLPRILERLGKLVPGKDDAES